MTSLSHKLFNKIDGRHIDLVISVTSGQVSTGLIYRNTGELPTILASRSRTVPFSNNPEPQEIKKRVIETLDVLLFDFTKELTGMYELSDLYTSHQVIHGITIGLSPLWLSVHTEKKEAIYESPKVITKETIGDLLIVENPEEVIDTSITEARANKYDIDPRDLVGIETPEVFLEVLYTRILTTEKETITDMVTKHFAVADNGIKIVPMMKAALSGVTELYGVTDTYSVIHFDAEDTYMIARSKQQGITTKNLTYGLGEFKRQLIKKQIAPDFIHTKDTLRAYYDRALDDSLSESIAYISDVEGQVLENLLVGELKEIPTPLFVFSSEIGVRFLTEDVFTPYKGYPKITKITVSSFDKYIKTIGKYVSPTVETLMLALTIDRDDV